MGLTRRERKIKTASVWYRKAVDEEYEKHKKNLKKLEATYNKKIK